MMALQTIEAVSWPDECDILADISDRRRTLTVEARKEGWVRGRQRRRFEVKVVIFSLTYEFLDSTILRSREAQPTGEIVASAIWAPSHLNTWYNPSSRFTKILFERNARCMKVESLKNPQKWDTAKTRAGDSDWENNPDSKNGCNVSAEVQYTLHSLTRAFWVTSHTWTDDVGRSVL